MTREEIDQIVDCYWNGMTNEMIENEKRLNEKYPQIRPCDPKNPDCPADESSWDVRYEQ